MAPLSTSDDISDLQVSSLELDARTTPLDTLISRSLPAELLKRDKSSWRSSPSEVYHMLTARDASNVTPNHAGAVDPNDINMKGIQAMFALIGATFVVGIIWFFFWAKNGGFQWRKGDWDDYKSTVLRRKGPNGTTLSNATKSTVLGGGSVVGDGYSDSSASTIEGTVTETMTEMSSEAPIIKEKSRRKETAKDRMIREVKQADFEGGHDEDVLAYIREKPARVGGINKDSEALHYGTDYTDTEGSAIHSVRQSRNTGQQGASSSRHNSPEKRQTRRDFSYTNDDAFSSVSSSQPEMPIPVHQPQEAAAPAPPPHRPGRYHSPSKQLNQDAARRSVHYPQHNANAYQGSVVSEVQNQHTKTYHHPLPTLTNQGAGRGYRRDRRDSLED